MSCACPRSSASILILLLAAWAPVQGLVAAGVPGADYVPGEVLVQFRDGAAVLGVEQVLAARPGHAPVAGRVSRLALRPGETPEQVAAELEALPEVEFAEPNYLRALQLLPNDPAFAGQWALRNEGQPVASGGGDPGGSPGADIGATEAWDVTTGSRSVVVAVIDTGIDLTHPEFVDNLWAGPDGEFGWDFIEGDGEPQNTHEDGHGIAVAGVIGARGDNGLAMTGTAWAVSLMSLRVFRDDGLAPVSDIVAAIDFARDNGARVINASFGRKPGDDGEPSFSRIEYDAIRAAGDAGLLFVAAACNHGADNDVPGPDAPCYPASYNLPNIIAVAASNNTDDLLESSSYGAITVDLAAPGEGIVSLGVRGPGERGEPLGLFSGTSIAAAFVSGTAALLLARNPALTPAELKAAILDNADSLRRRGERVGTGGRLNAAAALASVPAGTRPPASPPQADAGGGGGGGGAVDPLALLAALAVLGAATAARRERLEKSLRS